jgi:hypothetical protein
MSSWTTITDARIDADSPIDEDLMTDIRENAEYLYERHVRSGTATTGVRTIMARGKSSAQSLSLDGTGNGSDTVAITFSTDATDGAPAFSCARSRMMGPTRRRGAARILFLCGLTTRR